MKQQTAVEYMYNIMFEKEGRISKEEFEKVKAMFEKQIMDAHGDEQSYLQDDGSWRTITAEQYYNETFK